MGNVDRLGDYLVLLQIRQKAYQRNVVISGAMFLFAVGASTATLLFTEWNVRTIWLMGLFDVLFFSFYLTSWTKREIIKQNLELAKSILMKS
jgi:hypothetical protein